MVDTDEERQLVHTAVLAHLTGTESSSMLWANNCVYHASTLMGHPGSVLEVTASPAAWFCLLTGDRAGTPTALMKDVQKSSIC